MEISIGVILLPGVFAALLFLLFSYLYQQTRESYFRAWQIAWAAYFLHYVLQAWTVFGPPSAIAFLLSRFAFATSVMGIYVSCRLVSEDFRPHWDEVAFAVLSFLLCLENLFAHLEGGHFVLQTPQPQLELEVAAAVILVIAAGRFYLLSRQRDSVGFRLLAYSLLVWAPLLVLRQFHDFFQRYFGNAGYLMGPLAQMLIAVSMVIVLFDNERRTVQENALAFSTLDVDQGHLHTPAEVSPALRKLLDRLMRVIRVDKAAVCIAERWRAILPAVNVGLSEELLLELQSDGSGEYLNDSAYRRGGMAIFRNIAAMPEPLPAGPPGRFDRFKALMGRYGLDDVTAISLQTRDRNFGVIVFPHSDRKDLGPSQVRLLLGMAMQIAMTLENYAVMHETQRRTREYELLTQIGQVISSRLDPDEVLRSIHKELGLLFDTETFYVAFLDGEEVRFDFECIEGSIKPRRSRKAANGLTEYVIRTGQPLLIRSELEKVRAKLGVTLVPPRPAKSFCGVPIYMNGRSVGVLAAMNYDREFVYEQRDVEVLQTAAGQLAVAIENARLFAEEQRRSRYLAFLNSVSKMAISSQDSEQMLGEIVSEIQDNFNFDHIGVGILDYVTKEIEIKAEAGSSAHTRGKRVPLGSGVMGKAARTGEMILIQAPSDGYSTAVLSDTRSVLCIPITYGDNLLGVLNVESRREKAFATQDILILRTLADLLATALHNTIVFQKLQQQSITDGLTGIKTRRYFLEALSSEWKRASRSGRPFSVVLMDLDKFKEVNDSMGHLEGDLVLARVGRLLEQKCRQSNVVARYGGDEFVILMPETGVEQAQILSERLRLWLATDPMLSERGISGSFGVASFPIHGSTVEEIVRVADAGMYVSKHAGGNRVSTAEEFVASPTAIAQRQVLTAFIEGFLQREQNAPDAVEELVATLRKLCGAMEGREPMMEAVRTLSRACESREVHNAGHGENVSRYVELLGRELNLDRDMLLEISFACRIHDVGKIVVPERILCQHGPLTREEFAVIKCHPEVGAEIATCIADSELLQEVIRHHHERFDGTGYPDGLAGEKIPLGARMLAIADAFTAMQSDRPYAPAMSTAECIAQLEENAGTQFDGMLVRLFIRLLKTERAAKTGK